MLLASALCVSLLPYPQAATAVAAENATDSSTTQASATSAIHPALSVQTYNSDRANDVNTLTPVFKVTNTGTTPVDLQNVAIRYYFTSNGSNVLSYDMDSTSGSVRQSFLGTFGTLSPGQADADHYFQAGFDEFAGSLAAGGSIEFEVNIRKNANESFVQTDDYSYDPNSATFTDSQTVTAYYGGALVSGNEISALAPPSENYALNRTVTASSSLQASGWSPANLTNSEQRSVDGSDMGWVSEAGNNQWVKIDLGSNRTFNRVDLYAINWLSGTRGKNGIVGEGYPVDFKIEVSANDTDWTTVQSETNILRPVQAQNPYRFDAVEARYVRISTTVNRPMTSMSDIRAAFTEIEVYQDDAYVTPTAPPAVPSENRAIITPQEFTGAIQNPLMGMTEKDFRVNLVQEWPLDYMPWASMAMTYIPWNLLEGDVDDTIDKIAQYSNDRWRGKDENGNWVSYEDYNMKVIPRVYLKFPDTPFVGLEGNHWPSDMKINDFTSDNFDKRLKRLIQRLGALWDNDPRVAYVQMGVYGTWGEQHGTGVPTNIDAYFHQYFPNTRVEVRYEGHDQYSFGQYNDAIANMKTISNWKKQEVGGETAYDYNGADLLGTNPHLTMLQNANNAANMIRNVHATYLTWIGEYTYRNDPGYEGLPAYYENKEQLDAGAETIQKAFGYRYVLTEFNYPKKAEPGEDFAVQFKVKNTGAAPMYENWPVQISLKDPATNQIVWSDTFKNVDTRTWLPGEGYAAWNKYQQGNWSQSVLNYATAPQEYTIAGTFTLPDSIASNKDYMIQMAVLDPAGNVPSLRFAIQNYKKGGYAPMGYMGVGQQPQTIAIDPVYFDSPAKDISLHYYSADSSVQAEAAELAGVTIQEDSHPVLYADSGDPFNLNKLPIKAEDQYGRAHNAMVGMPVTWSIASGSTHAEVQGTKLIPLSAGQGTLTASIGGIVSNEIPFTVEQTSVTGSVAGQVKDNFGRTLQGVQVQFISPEGETFTGTTDATGAYTITSVPVRDDYTVTATKDGYQSLSLPDKEITGAQTATVDLTLLVNASGNFSDTFASGSAEWSAGTGTWNVTAEEYVQSAGTTSASWKYSTAIKNRVWYDATYEIDLKSNGSSWASFMFRKQSQSHSANNTGYFVALTGTGEVKLQKAGSTVTTLATVSGAVTNTTAYHHVKIVTVGSNIKVYVDASTTPIINVNDTSYTAGYAGLGNGGGKWYYDNVNISVPAN